MSEVGQEEIKGTGGRAGSAAGDLATHAAHSEEITAFLERMEGSSSGGLTEDEAEKRLGLHGPNRLPEGKKKSNVLRLLEQFINPLVLTLLAAAAIAVVVGFSAHEEPGFLARFGDAI